MGSCPNKCFKEQQISKVLETPQMEMKNNYFDVSLDKLDSEEDISTDSPVINCTVVRHQFGETLRTKQ